MFTNIPNNYSSMRGALTYEYINPRREDIVIEIKDARNNELLGVKKFYSSTYAKLNIAPLIFDKMLPEPKFRGGYGLEFSESGFPRVTLSVGDTTSEERYFTYAKEPVESPALLTTMPQNRILFATERDILWSTMPTATSASYTLTGRSRESGEFEVIGGDLCPSFDTTAVYHIVADQLMEEYSQLEVSVSDGDGGSFERIINYTLEPSKPQGYRLAWISSKGGVEQYTFPVIVGRTQLKSGARLLKLRSAYGTREQIEALSEIVSSPKVWRADPDGYVEVKLKTTEINIQSDGVLSIVTIEIEDNG